MSVTDPNCDGNSAWRRSSAAAHPSRVTISANAAG
jgi:hypothetical protein